MKHDRRFLLVLLGTLPLGCVVGTFEPNWDKDTATVGGNASSGGGTSTLSGATMTGGKSGVIGSGTTGGSTLTTIGGSASAGGNSNSTAGGATAGGATNVGGTTTAGGTNAGGATTAGGAASSGGAPNAGGTKSAGGAPTAGGNTASGGAVVTVGGALGTGGALGVGGLSGIGGVPGIGGALAAGGTISVTLGGASMITLGGALAAGGTTTIGVTATGGVATTTGGTAATTGGAPLTGGAPPVTGGAPGNGGAATGGAATGGAATGGAATGGAPATGGSATYLATAIAAGRDHVCALMADGTVYCWGNDCDAQLGDIAATAECTDTDPAKMTKSAKPVKVMNVFGATAIATGGYHSCAVISGKVYCWGYGGEGQLGNGKSGYGYVSGTPVNVSGITSASSLVAGEKFTCALLTEGTVSCWGYNGQGQLGNGKTDNSAIPVSVISASGSSLPLRQVATIAAGRYHTCAVLDNGMGLCWGYNYSGQLGNEKTDDSSSPVKTTFSPASEMGTGQDHSCGRDTDGTVACWGYGYYGQLGNGATDNSLQPVKPQISAAARTIGLGYSHSCAVLNTSNSIVECWGYNGFGQIGDGTYEQQNLPIEAKGLTDALSVVAGEAHTCALAGKGAVYCWGYGAFGQIGDGTTGDSPIPTLVSGF